ncbi:hypothetical protein ACJVC5_00850 [Peredibacter sp. HCB2-198]|uniref:TPM domain-containing protein n=1 Tax=Peredibacter sp. HCB2-198 TaxID=3383025 RepID=UPI0038B4AEFE
MKKILLQDDIQHVETRLKQFEANTGCELLLVVADASDPYPAASWRFGVISGFLLSLCFSYYFEFHHSYFWPLTILLLTLLMTWVGHFPWAKRLALSDWEIDRECGEKSVEYFHTLGTSQVSHKVTAMIMVSILEKRIMVLVDEKLKTQITQEELNELVAIMKKHFKDGNMGLGFIQSIQALEEKILKDFGGRVSDAKPSELKDQIHFL